MSPRDGDAFFVHHPYFTSADDPYDKLRRAPPCRHQRRSLGHVNSRVLRPFPRPSTGKVAVRVINRYGEEVMKVVPL